MDDILSGHDRLAAYALHVQMQEDVWRGQFPLEYAPIVWAQVLERCNEFFPKTAPQRREWPPTPTKEELEDPQFTPKIRSRSRLEDIYNGESVQHPNEPAGPDAGNENRFSSIKLQMPHVDPKPLLAAGKSVAASFAGLGRVRPPLRPVWR